jgi:hypothetical protein
LAAGFSGRELVFALSLSNGLRLTGLKSADIHGVEFKECCFQFSLLKASTETHLSGFFQNRWRLLYIQFAF